MKSWFVVATVLATLTVAGTSGAQITQNPGPDVIVGSLHELQSWGSANGIAAFSVGTTSCNIGTQNLNWFSNVNQHPVIGSTAYRILNGRCEMIGQSFLKHGFFALSEMLCGSCPTPTDGTTLGVLCSDPYSANLNGTQSNLGPKWEVNAYTGAYPFPATNLTATGNAIFKRLQIAHTDLDPAANTGAIYVVEGQYVTPDDATSGNGFNNASWKQVNFSPSAGGYNVAFPAGATTHQQQPAIFAWQFFDPTVQMETVNVPGEGRFHVARKVTDNGNGTKTYEYAVHNLNSDRSAQSFTINLLPNTVVTNIGFHDVPYHSGEIWDGTDWTSTVGATSITWATAPFSTNPNANALRWATTYNFRFTADKDPLNGSIGLFKPGTPTSVNVSLGAPAFTMALATPVPAEVHAFTPNTIDVQVTPINGTPNSGSATLFASINGGAFNPTSLLSLGSNVYRANLPTLNPFDRLDFYFSIGATGGGAPIKLPANAPTSYFTTNCWADLTTIQSDNFQTNQGWTVINGATLSSGGWQRATPVASLGAPSVDADLSGQCYVTDNAPGADVDGGITALTSPVIDMGFASDALIEFSFWYDNSAGANPGTDSFSIELSNDDGQTWTGVETVSTTTAGWVKRVIRVSDYLFGSYNVRLRFTASDLFTDSNVEAAVDAFRVRLLLPLIETYAKGNVGVTTGQGPVDCLRINNSAGGPMRIVPVPVGQNFSFDMTSIPTTPFPVFFFVMGQLYLPAPQDAFAIPGIGTTNIIPCPAALGNPALFVLTNNFPQQSGCPQILGSTLTPWSFTVPGGIPFPLAFTLQAIIYDPSSTPLMLSVTNAVILDVRI